MILGKVWFMYLSFNFKISRVKYFGIPRYKKKLFQLNIFLWNCKHFLCFSFTQFPLIKSRILVTSNPKLSPLNSILDGYLN